MPANKNVTTPEDTPLVITGLLQGVSDVDGDTAFTLLSASDPAHGTISNLDTVAGTLTYTPDADYNGPDGFEFTVADTSGATGTARVDITVGECGRGIFSPVACKHLLCFG